MSWVAAAAVGGSIVGGMIQGDAAEDAANIQAGSAAGATAEQRRQFDIAREDLAPFRAAGGQAVGQISHLLGLGDPNANARAQAAQAAGIKKPTLEDAAAEHLKWHIAKYGVGYGRYSDMSAAESQTKDIFNRMMSDYDAQVSALPQAAQTTQASQATAQAPGSGFGALNRRFTLEDFENDPVNKLSFQFGQEEGAKALRRTFGAAGMARSGAAVKALTRFGTDYAGQRAGESRNRFIQDQDITFNRLSGVAGTGQTATTNTAQLGANMATQVGQNLIGAGNARGAASIAQGNAASSGFNTAANMLQTRFLLDGMNRPTQSNTRLPSFTMDNAFENFA